MAHGRDADGHGRMAWAGVSGMRMRGWPMGMGGMGMGGMGVMGAKKVTRGFFAAVQCFFLGQSGRAASA